MIDDLPIPFDRARDLVRAWRLESFWSSCIPQSCFDSLIHEFAVELARGNQRLLLATADPNSSPGPH